MEISLPSELSKFVEQKVEQGLYASEAEVVQAALEWFRSKDKLISSIGAAPSGATWAVLSDLNSGDIEAVAFIVLMQATKDADEDLKQIMAEVKAMNNAKQKLRALMEKVNRDISANLGQTDRHPPLVLSKGLGSRRAYHNAPLPYPDPLSKGGVKLVPTDLYEGKIDDVSQLEMIRDGLRDRLDSMSEMGEMQSLRLQMAMDRRSKFIETLSNIMKKMSDTQGTLIQNLK